MRARLSVIESLLKGRPFYPLFMSEFARTVPAGVRVTNLATLSQDNGAVKLTIGAVADADDDVANWLRALEKDSHFDKVELGPVTSNGKQVNFSISTMYTLKL